MRKFTTTKFVADATYKHGTLYDYSEVEYKDSKVKVRIVCRLHGVFEQSPSKHLMGQGCPKCALLKRGMDKLSDTSEFMEKALRIPAHEGKYDYSEVDYVSATKKVSIICKEHGVFYQTPNDHLCGKGCPICALQTRGKDSLGREEFIRRSQAVQKIAYDYSLVEYRTSKDRVKIICPTHGMFEQNAVDHMLGKGCRACMKTGYQPNKPGILYVLNSGDITKVGITNKDVTRRVKEITRSSGMDFKVLTYICFKDGLIPDDIETNILRELRLTHQGVVEKFDGSTECFLNVDYDALILRITQLASQVLAARNNII